MKTDKQFRVEHDSIGERTLPRDVYYGVQSLRASENFHITGLTMHPEIVNSIAEIKKASAIANYEIGLLDKKVADAIVEACGEIAAGKLHDAFIVDPIQGGAGTSLNMNANEVIANRGNAIAGAIHLMSVYPVGITQCTNPEAFSGGSDEESDEKLRERVLASYKRLPNGANAAFYEQEAMRFPNVAAAKAVGRARGIGTVDVYVSTHAGAPDEKLLGEIEAVLQKKREIAVDVEVKAPTEKTVNVSAELTAEQGWTMQEITDAATAALQAYFTGERLGEAVYTAKLASILYGVEGVKNCHLLTPDEDVSVSATELPVLGTVTITEIGAGEA